MKKSVCVVIVILILLSVSGCSREIKAEQKGKKVYGVWFSCFELDKMLLSGDFKNAFSAAVKNCADLGISDVFIHTRPFCDSIYPSNYFPLRESVKGIDFDVLSYIIETCHNSNLRVHAWLNPYRVKTDTTDFTALAPDSPARIWLEDDNEENDNDISLVGGIYLNPASGVATRLILDGIRELLRNYDIDGIHFDDYFYPTQSEDFDKALYDKYCSQNPFALSLSDWRRSNVNAFISGVGSLIKYEKSNVIFSISPAASVENNYHKMYADVELWVKNGYIDWIIPQLYFGFQYPENDFKFDVLYDRWQKIAKEGEAELIIGLASYKIDTQNDYERKEWSNGNVIGRQVEYISGSSNGCCFFSYSSLFGSTPNQISERENISLKS